MKKINHIRVKSMIIMMMTVTMMMMKKKFFFFLRKKLYLMRTETLLQVVKLG